MQVSPGPWDSPAVIIRNAAISTAKLTYRAGAGRAPGAPTYGEVEPVVPLGPVEDGPLWGE